MRSPYSRESSRSSVLFFGRVRSSLRFDQILCLPQAELSAVTLVTWWLRPPGSFCTFVTRSLPHTSRCRAEADLSVPLSIPSGEHATFHVFLIFVLSLSCAQFVSHLLHTSDPLEIHLPRFQNNPSPNPRILRVRSRLLLVAVERTYN